MQTETRTLERWTEVAPGLRGTLEDLEAARIHLEEAAAALVSFLDGVQADPGRLEAVETRLAELERLEHKYEADEAELLTRRDAIAGEIGVVDEAKLLHGRPFGGGRPDPGDPPAFLVH